MENLQENNMKVQEINTNYNIDTTQIQSCKPTIQTAVSLYRMRYSIEEIYSKFDQNTPFYLGHNFQSDFEVTERIVSGILKKSKENLGEFASNLIIEGYAKAFVDSLSGSEMDSIITRALEACSREDDILKFQYN